MANTQTSVPVFTSGQVLTAAQQNQINTGIPVFADSTARDAAFGGTGEKTLAEGQFAFLEDTNATQFYDGSTWNPVGIAPGLVPIVTDTFSAQSTVTLSDVFSATYHSYLLTLTNLSGTDSVLKATLGTTATGYSYSGREWYYNGASADRRAVNTTYFETAFIKTNAGGSSLIYFQNPFLSVRSTFQTMAITTASNPGAVQQQGFLDDTTSYTDIVFTMGSGTFSGTITAYGLAQS
jgi:hypothetical protein